MYLIITEKPSVAQEYAKVLGAREREDGYLTGNNFIITWCVGHLVRLSYPEKYDESFKKWNIDDLPFIPEKYLYEIIPDVKKQFNVVKKLLNNTEIETIYYAGDPAREGIYIQYLVRNAAGHNRSAAEKVVWIDSQTEEEIRRGIREAKNISCYDSLAASGYMRAIEDYLIGINFSRALTLKFGNIINSACGNEQKHTVISIGRVMICVLGMIVRREREIRNFHETCYYRLKGIFKDNDKSFGAEWKVCEDSEYCNSNELYNDTGFKNKNTVQSFADKLKNSPAYIENITYKTEKKAAPLLFNLAELQNQCSKLFKISPDETLKVIQSLYEKKLVTYPRTDARVLSSAIAKEIDNNIRGLLKYEFTAEFAQSILNSESYKNIIETKYVNDKKVTDHYAVIPTGLTNGIEDITELEKNIYNIIAERFLSVFYPPAEYRKIVITVKINNEKFIFSEKILVNTGYMEVAGENTEGKSKNTSFSYLTDLKKGSKLKIDEFIINQGKTTPPERYTTGSMVLAMENAGKFIEDEQLREQIKSNGIGTSATRAEIIKKLDNIGYIAVNSKTQIMTPDRLGEMIYELVNITVPTLLIPEYTAMWERGLEQIAEGKKKRAEYNADLNNYITEIIEKIKKDDAKKILIEKITPFASGKIMESMPAQKKAGTCPECGKDLIERKGKFGNFISCSGYPECKYIKKPEQKPLKKAGICPECGKDLVMRRGKYGIFISCSGYPECRYIKKSGK